MMIMTVWTKWKHALRSGRYRQIRGDFMEVDPDGTDHGYCALGLLGMLQCEEPVTYWRVGERVSLLGALLHCIIRWNDTEKLSFEEIADRLDNYEDPDILRLCRTLKETLPHGPGPLNLCFRPPATS